MNEQPSNNDRFWKRLDTIGGILLTILFIGVLIVSYLTQKYQMDTNDWTLLAIMGLWNAFTWFINNLWWMVCCFILYASAKMIADSRDYYSGSIEKKLNLIIDHLERQRRGK